MSYHLVLGLEIHLHLKTSRKMFCRCDAFIYGEEPNTHTCPTCLGLPGALPVPNLEAIKKTQLLGLALNSEIAQDSKFDRKHYFYPDLPKGYQISQYKEPLCLGGYIELSNGKKAEIERIHLEEDTAKSVHEGGKTLIDFNMCSMPLVEIVTKPIFESVEEAVEFSKKVQEIVREYDLGDADMEKGQMRLEPNISLQTDEQYKNNQLPNYKVEIKNINSFRFMEKAVKAEINRQEKILSAGDSPIQENRGYDEATGTTVSQRSKEDAHDYRYFPEPDIPPMVFDDDYLLELRKDFDQLMNNTPTEKKKRLLHSVNSKLDEIIANLELNEIEKMIQVISKGYAEELVVNTYLNNKDIRELPPNEVVDILKEKQDKLTDTSELEAVVSKVVQENADAVASFKSGKENALQFLLGMIMRETKGKADANIAKEILLKEIE